MLDDFLEYDPGALIHREAGDPCTDRREGDATQAVFFRDFQAATG
jgi:hypothetical protein